MAPFLRFVIGFFVAVLAQTVWATPPELFPRNILWEQAAGSGASGNEPGLRGLPADTLLSTFRWAPGRDVRSERERQVQRINEDGSVSAGALLSAMGQASGLLLGQDANSGQQAWVLTRAQFQEWVQSRFQASAALDIHALYADYLRQITSFAWAQVSLVRILDQEAMRRGMEPNVSPEASRFAAVSVLVDFAVERGLFRVRPRLAPSGNWTASGIADVEQQIPLYQLAAALQSRPVELPHPDAWAGWPLLLDEGFRPCEAALTPAQIRALPAPRVGQPICRSLEVLTCPNGRDAESSLHSGRICGLSPRELFGRLQRQVRGTSFRVPLSVRWRARFEALDPYWQAVEDARQRGAQGLGVDPSVLPPFDPFPLTLTHLEGTYEELLEQFDAVVEASFSKMRRLLVWERLFRDAFPDRSWFNILQSSSRALRAHEAEVREQYAGRDLTPIQVRALVEQQLQAKAQGILYRELAFRLFQRNRPRFQASHCRAVQVDCRWNPRQLAETLFPERLFEGQELPGGPSAPSSTLGQPALYERVSAVSTELLSTVFGAPNEKDPPRESEHSEP